MAAPERRTDINMSAIPVSGIGGLGLVAVAILMAVVFPEARWLLVLGISGGVMIAVAFVLARRRHTRRGPSGDNPTILFRAEPADSPRFQTGARESDADAPRRDPFSLPIGELTILAMPGRDRS